MKKKLVTLAIKKPEDARFLQKQLKNMGVDAELSPIESSEDDINSVGQRIVIDESDLSKSLNLMDRIYMKSNKNTPNNQSVSKNLLIPVDFSDYSFDACKIGFELAHQLHLEIIILHVYMFPSTIYDFAKNFVRADEEKRITDASKHDIDKLKKLINSKIELGEWPDITYKIISEEGVPEEVIIEKSKIIQPLLIVMGTRGKSRKEADLIGSVTAQVIEYCKFPVLAIPESSKIDFSVKRKLNLLFATNFDNRFAVSLDTIVYLFSSFNYHLQFIHFDEQANTDDDDEIKLDTIRHFFSTKYPQISTDCSIITGPDMLVELDSYIKSNMIDLLILNTHKRNIFSRLFNPGMARRMIFHASMPILAINV